MAGFDFRLRERIVLFTGAAAIALLGLLSVAAIAGHSLGGSAAKLASLLVAFYLCARIAAHAKTLEERGSNEQLARVAWLAAPAMLLVLLVQTVRTSTPHVALGTGFQPSVHLGLGLRIELTTDVALFALFLATCMAVWTDETEGVSASLTRISYVVVGLFTVVTLALVWGAVGVGVGLVRLLASLFVLSVVGWLLVAILRRVERIDEQPPDAPLTPTPTAPVGPIGPQSLKPQP